jgi:acetyl esterase/lipase
MKTNHLLFLMIITNSLSAQQKIFLYPPSEKVTIDGFTKDKEPPYMDYYKARNASGRKTAILICPGGSYTNLADQHEGADVARFYKSHGFDAFVLHYRLNIHDQSGHRHPDQCRDVTTAMRIIRSRASEWNIHPERIGILGFSAGGHLASMCATMPVQPDRTSRNKINQYTSRPDFAILIYPVITLSGPAAHRYSREMLLGRNPDPHLADSLSTHHRVNEQTPPVFIVFSSDDDTVPPENGILFYQALQKYAIPASLHIYDHGGHGYGMAPHDPALNTWPELSVTWVNRLWTGKHH